MGMTHDEWLGLEAILEHGWPGSAWSETASVAYRTMLDEFEPVVVLTALKKLALKGQRLRPSVGEIVGALTEDVSVPTPDEAYDTIFTALRRTAGRPERFKELMNDAHPIVKVFALTQGYGRLSQLPVEDPDWGTKHRNDLMRQFSEFALRAKERIAHGQAIETTLDRGNGVLRPLDPLSSLRQGVPELSEG